MVFPVIVARQLRPIELGRHRVEFLYQAPAGFARANQPEAKKLAQLATACESSCARRLGYLLECAGHVRQARGLEQFARKAKTFVPLDPSIRPVSSVLSTLVEKDARWKLLVNERVEADF